MNPRLFIPLVASLALCASSFADNFGAASPTPFKARAVVHHHTVIDSVSSDSITTSDAAGTHPFKINAATEVTFKGAASTVSNLQAGMRVLVTPDAVHPDTAARIAADDPPKDPAPHGRK